MNIETVLVPKEEWKIVAGLVHKEVFGTEFEEEYLSYDLAILVKKDGENLCYGTLEELDKETAHINFGGIFNKFKTQKFGYIGFHEMVIKLKNNYKRIGFSTKTKNLSMIKLGINEGFEIVGIRKVYGITNLDFLLEGEK